MIDESKYPDPNALEPIDLLDFADLLLAEEDYGGAKYYAEVALRTAYTHQQFFLGNEPRHNDIITSQYIKDAGFISNEAFRLAAIELEKKLKQPRINQPLIEISSGASPDDVGMAKNIEMLLSEFSEHKLVFEYLNMRYGSFDLLRL